MINAIEVATTLGTVKIRPSAIDRAEVDRARNETQLTFKGRAYRVSANLQLGDQMGQSGWGTLRTEAGNESKAALGIYDVEAGCYTESAPIWRACRDALVEAATKLHAEQPELFRQAEVERLDSEIRLAEASITRAQEQLRLASIKRDRLKQARASLTGVL